MADHPDHDDNDDDDHHLRRHHRSPSHSHSLSSSPLTYHSALPEQAHFQSRPCPDTQPSLPRPLFRTSSNSIFGSNSISTSASASASASTAPRSNTLPQRPALSIRPATPYHLASLDSHSHSSLPSANSAARRERRYEDEVRATVDRRRIPRVEKDADDPSTPPASSAGNRQHSSTVTTLSRLFAVQGAVSPDPTRAPSFTQPLRPYSYTRHMHSSETAALPEHLYARGLLEGRHSDISVWAFGKEYKLHRLILDRAPFFATALSEPWLEANAKEMTVRPDEIDGNITQQAFELALQRLYGCPDLADEDAHAVGLFATGCWLEMADVIESSIESMLRQMRPATLAPLISLVTKNYYGRAGDKILASAKAMLCRDGWRMPLSYWDGVPADIAREIVGGDGLFVDGEWERWVLAKRILDRRLKARAVDAGLTEPGSRRKVAKAPPAIATTAVRFDAVSRRAAPTLFSHGVTDALYKYVSLYTHPSVEPLLVLLDEGIHYVHLNFEQLQYIRQARDIVGLPVMPDKVVSNALWQQMELRQRVMNARDSDLELGLAVQAPEESLGGTTPTQHVSPTESKGKHRAILSPATEARDFSDAEDDYDSQSWDGTGRPRKFWIPASDANIVMGGSAEPVVATSSSTLQRHAARLSATVHPEDVTWASDFATSTTAAPRPGTSESLPDVPPPAVSYSHLPPFRFSAEFPAPRLLKERKRVYSRTVFYAGSLWNIYIQKVASARSNKQLGVYLHRAKERETEEAVFATSAGMASANTAVHPNGHVEGRIGLLERGMRDQQDRRRHRHRHRRRETLSDEGRVEGEESSGSTGDPPDASLLPSSSTRTRTRTRPHRKTGQTDILASSPTTAFPDLSDTLGPAIASSSASDSESDSADDDDDDLTPSLHTSPPPPPRTSSVPALPPYVDARPTIKTYFKIFSPSRGGRMLSIYESAPDKFNFSQSWGWKSNTLMLDEGLLDDVQIGVLDEQDAQAQIGKERGREGDGRLRFMVVIGNV